MECANDHCRKSLDGRRAIVFAVIREPYEAHAEDIASKAGCCSWECMVHVAENETFPGSASQRRFDLTADE